MDQRLGHHRPRAWQATCGAIAIAAAGAAAAPPAGFVKTPIATGLAEPTVVAFTPDNRILIGQRAGSILIVVNGQLLAQPVVQFPNVPTDRDYGLLGLLTDPNFNANHYIYVWYTTPESDGPHNRVSRLTMNGNTASRSTELILWENPDVCRGASHHGGGIAFGTDGNLFIPCGDQFNSDFAQDMSVEHGKILRIMPNGGTPPDNPFLNQPGVSPLIWALGARNPFRSAVDPVTGRFYIADVGLDTWEEIDRPTAACNLGWPFMEGPECFAPTCTPYLGPIKAYSHNDPVYVTNLSDEDSAAVILGCVYRGNAFPPEYNGNLFFADYVNGWIRRLILDANGSITGEALFDSPPDAGTVVDLKPGPDGALYGVDIFGGPYGPAVFKIAYAGGDLPPIPVASGSPTTGQPPLTVNFHGDQSSDPDNGPQPLSFSWDFGDGQTSTQPNPVHTYTTRGAYTARLTVGDGAAVAEADVPIVVGSPPVPTILQPTAGTTYICGNVITFNGSATDPEDGTLPASAFTWQVFLHHLNHLHPFLGPMSGFRSSDFLIPDTGHPPEHTAYLIRLTVTDSDGISTTVEREITAVVSPLHFDSAPTGIPIFIDTGPLNTPNTYSSTVGFRHTISAQATFTISNRQYLFDIWSNGSDRYFDLTAPPGGASFVVHYVMACPGDWDGNGTLTPSDIAMFVNDWFADLTGGTRNADYDGDGVVAPADIASLVQDWLNSVQHGC